MFMLLGMALTIGGLMSAVWYKRHYTPIMAEVIMMDTLGLCSTEDACIEIAKKGCEQKDRVPLTATVTRTPENTYVAECIYLKQIMP